MVSIDLGTGIAKSLSSYETADSVDWETSADLVLDTLNNRVLAINLTHRENQTSVIAIDLDTGKRATLSGPSLPDNLTLLSSAFNLAADYSNNRLFTTERYRKAIIEIDLGTGARRVVSDSSTPDKSSDIVFTSPLSIARDKSNKTLFVMDEHETTLFSINETTGERAIISAEAVNHGTNNYHGAVYDSKNNSVLVCDGLEGAIISIPVDGSARFEYSGKANGSLIEIPESIIKEDSDSYIVTDRISGLLRLDMVDGSTTVIADHMTPAENPTFSYGSQITINPETSQILLADPYNAQLLSFDSTTGERTVISDNIAPNASVPFNSPFGIAVSGTLNSAVIGDYNQMLLVDLATGVRCQLVAGGSTAYEFEFDEDAQTAFLIDGSSNSVRLLDVVTGEIVTISR